MKKIKTGIKILKERGIRDFFRVISMKLKVRAYGRGNSGLQRRFWHISESEIKYQQEYKFGRSIKISILVPLYNTPEHFLREMLDSVACQTYSNWELCLADGSQPGHEHTGRICNEFSEKHPGKVKYKKLEENLGISANTNECLKLATGDYIAMFDHDDALHPSALFENVKAICEKDADVIYSDECKFKTYKKDAFDYFFKPDFSPDLLYCQNYICHFLVIKKPLFDTIGGLNPEFDGAQDYDLILRLTRLTDKIVHIPKVLYFWRFHIASATTGMGAKPYAQDAGLCALREHIETIPPVDYASVTESENKYVYDVRYNTIRNTPLVSLIIPIKDGHKMTEDCIGSITGKTTYANYEILILNNRSEKRETKEWLSAVTGKDPRIKVFDADFDFNWSRINNFGIEHAAGDAYVFLNNDTLVISPDWLERLCENALRDDIGAVGPMLLYKDKKIQHAGVIVGMGGWADHVFKELPPVHHSSPYVSPCVSRNVLAVTGACLCVSRKTVSKIGLFDENFIICGSDVEFCVRAHKAGLRNLYCAFVRLYHLESKSRDSFIPEVDFKMSDLVYDYYRKNGDPYFNVNLDINSVKPRVRN